MKSSHPARSARSSARRYAPVVFAALSTPLLNQFADAQTWIGRGTASWSVASQWVGGTVPVSSPATSITLPNFMTGSYRTFNDLGVLRLGELNVASRTPTATFVGQAAGSALQFVDGARINSNDIGLMRFGGTTGVVNDMRLEGNLIYGGTGHGTLALATGVSDAAGFAGRLTIDAPAGDNGGNLRLEGANTFTGGVDLKRGLLEVGANTSLGTGVLTANGGFLRTTGAQNIGNSITANASLNLRPNTSFTLSGVISGNGGIDLRSTGDSASTVTLTAANTYTGATVIDATPSAGSGEVFPMAAAGSIVFSAAGSSVNSSSYTVRNGGVLNLTNTTGPSQDRLSDTAPITLGNGRLHAIGNSTTAVNEAIGAMTINGNAIVSFNTAAGGTTFTTPSLTRGDRATMDIALGHANSHFKSTVAPVLVNGIIPWISGANSTITSPRELMTIDVVNGIRPLAAGDYAIDFSGGPTSNVKISADTVNNAVVDVNALVVGTGGATNLTGAGTIRPASGAVILATSGTVTNNIDFGTAEGIIHVGAIATMDGVISGSNGITKAGDFALTTNSVHTYTGPTTINQGGLRFTNPDAFDSTSGFVVRTNSGAEIVPTIDYRGAGTAVIDRPAVVESGAMRLGSGGTLGTSSMEYSGNISGPGNLILDHGRFKLSGNNTFTGITRVADSELEFSSDANLGGGDVFEFAGTIGRGVVLGGDWNTDKLVRVTGLFNSTFDTNGFNATWNRGVEASNGFTKVGAGTLRINGFSPAFSTQFWDIGTSSQTGGRVEVDGDARMSLEVNDGLLAGRGTFTNVRVFTDKGTLAPGDIGGPGVGIMDAAGMIISLGSNIEYDLGTSTQDYLKSHTTLNKASGSVTPVNFAFRLNPDITLGTYTLIEYFENPSAALTFTAADFAFTSDLAGFDGTFQMAVLPNGWQAVQFTVTAVPEPTTLGAVAIGAMVLLARRRARKN